MLSQFMKVFVTHVINVITRLLTKEISGNMLSQSMKVSVILVINVITRRHRKII